MHQGLHSARDEAVVDDKILVDVEAGIATLEIAGAVTGYPMTQREILGPRRCPDRVGLHEPKGVEGALERGRREKAAGNRYAPQIVEGHTVAIIRRFARARRT
jgi:hypothetical protein